MFLILTISFLLGSLNGAVLFSHFFAKDDIRKFGSKNPGATNAFRIHGLKFGLFVLLFDFFKSYISLFITWTLMPSELYLSLFCVVCGHCFSPLLNGKGGKGVAPLIGGIFFIQPLLSVFLLILWSVMLYFSKISGIATFSCLIVLVLWNYFSQHSILFAMTLLLVLLRHYGNFQQLFNKYFQKN